MSRIVTTQCDAPLCTATFRHAFRSGIWEPGFMREELDDAGWTGLWGDFCPEHERGQDQ